MSIYFNTKEECILALFIYSRLPNVFVV